MKPSSSPKKKNSTKKFRHSVILENDRSATFTDMSELYLDDSERANEANNRATRNLNRDSFHNGNANRSLEFHDSKLHHMDTVFQPNIYQSKSPSPQMNDNGMFSNVNMRYSVNGNPFTVLLPYSHNTSQGQYNNQAYYDNRSFSNQYNHDFNGGKSKREAII
jgi:hypothetical protein